MRYHRYLIIALALLLVFAPVAVVRAQSLASWTVLIYLDGDNNLEREAVDDFLEMSAVGSNADLNIVVQFDRIAGYDGRYGDWTGTKRFLITQGMTPEPAHVIADLGEVNMGDPQTLIDFVTWGRASFPAQRTAVIIWNHGDGWRAANFLKRRRKAIAWDDTAGRDALNMAELRDALSTVTGGGASPIDLLAFDACLMAMIEIDAQIHPYVRVRTGSEETEPGTGYPFDDILADLRDHPEWDASELGKSIVERYHAAYEGETQSAVDLGEGYATLITAVDTLAGALIAHHEDRLGVIQTVRRETQQFQIHYVDLVDLAERLIDAIDIPDVQQAAQAVVDAAGEVTLAERHGSYWPGAHGITIYFPAQQSGWDSAYDGENDYLSFTTETRWDDFLVAYLELANACEPDVYEPDNDPSSATPIGIGDEPQQHGFCPETDAADWVSFETQGGQTYEIATLELEPYCDTVIKLYDTDGQTVLVQDDDGGEEFASRIEWTSPASATYYVEVVEYFGRTGPDTGYALRVDPVSPTCEEDDFEPDDDPTLAAGIDVDGPAQAHNFCSPADTADWVSFQATQGETYAIETSSLGLSSNTALTLYDTDGATSLLSDDDGGTEPLASRIQWTCPVSGTYFVRVHDAGAQSGEHTDYQLRVSTVPFTVYGTVHLQGRNAFAGTEIAVQPISYTVTTDISGMFDVTATVPCTITAWHPGYLLHEWTVTGTTGVSLTLETVTLLGGDINGDREVDILDIAYIGARFQTDDALADLNGDGIVDILDIVMAASNFKRGA
jgi:hypothetical protein